MYTPKGELNDELLKLMQDPEALTYFEGCKSPEEGYQKVKRYLPNISMDEFQCSMKIMAAYLEESKDGLLTEEDLDQVAGGKNTAKIVGASMGGVGAAAGVIGGVVASMAFTV